MKILLIAGTDTNVGKTVLTTALVAYWQTYLSSKSLGLIKLIQTGVGDWELYEQLFASSASLEIAKPLSFKSPLAPPLAAEKERTVVKLEQVWQTFSSLQQRHDFIIAEALGGLGSPVTPELTVADLARDWRLPTILVVPVKLGAIGQVVANVALARHSQVNLKGIVISCVQPEGAEKLADWSPPDLIESLTQVPVLGILPHLSQPNDLENLTQVASNLNWEVVIPNPVMKTSRPKKRFIGKYNETAENPHP